MQDRAIRETKPTVQGSPSLKDFEFPCFTVFHLSGNAKSLDNKKMKNVTMLNNFFSMTKYLEDCMLIHGGPCLGQDVETRWTMELF